MHGSGPEGIQKKAALVICYLSLTNDRVKLES